jgi:hypothetical protein
MAEVPSFLGTEFDIFERKPKQTSTVETNETIYRPIASVDQADIEFVKPGDSNNYVDLDFKLFVKGKLMREDGTDLPDTDYTAGINNLLHSLFSQCTIYLNGTLATQANELYPYRLYIETLLTHSTDAANSPRKMAFWQLDEGDMLAGVCSHPAEASNSGFCSRWNQLKDSQTVEMYGRLHSDICNVPLYLLSGVKIQIKLTKANKSFYLLSNKADSKATFKFQEVPLYAKGVRPAPSILASHTETPLKGYPARYNFTRVELKTFTFAKVSQPLSIDNAVLGVLPKRLLFTMLRNTDFLGTEDSNPFKFKHYDVENFSMYVSGKQIPSEGLSLDMGHEETSVMGYRTLFEGLGIHHSNTGLQINSVLYINGYFMLVFDLTPDPEPPRGTHRTLFTETSAWILNLLKLSPTRWSAYYIWNMTVQF